MLTYWLNLKGHNSFHPTKNVLQECWEHSEYNIRSFGWIGHIKAENEVLCNMQCSSTVCYSVTPPWLFVMPTIDLNIQQQIIKQQKKYSDPLKFFTLCYIAAIC